MRTWGWAGMLRDAQRLVTQALRMMTYPAGRKVTVEAPGSGARQSPVSAMVAAVPHIGSASGTVVDTARSWSPRRGIDSRLTKWSSLVRWSLRTGESLPSSGEGCAESRSGSRRTALPWGGKGAGLLLFAAVLLGAAPTVQAVNCSDAPYFGVIDGNVVDVPSGQVQIDMNCTIRNFQAPNELSTNFSFYTAPGQTEQRWLVIFDNVTHTGNMSCNATHEHKIWFTNGSSSKILEGCQNLLIPVEKIDKQNPGPTASIGVPFTYTLTMPVLFDPATGTVIDFAGSNNDLHGIVLTDDLNATGVDLSYMNHVVYWRSSGETVEHTFSNDNGLLTFQFPSGFVIPAGEQIDIEITVVLEDTPANAPGTQFINTAKWEFGRLIDGTFYEPLPGENGVTEPMIIAEPVLTVTKTGPATLGSTLNLGEWGYFGVEVENIGLSGAWNVTVVDQLPTVPSNDPPHPEVTEGGMCDTAPEVLAVSLGGVTLTEDTHYSLTFSGAPGCELTLNLLEEAGPIGAGQSLVIDYRTRLDEDTDDGAELTNIVGATQWSNGPEMGIGQTYTCPLTDGTPGILDCQDAHTVLAAFSGYFFEKTVHDPDTGDRITAALSGETVLYRVRIRTIDEDLSGLRILDDMGALNASTVFEPGSFNLRSWPAGADNHSTPGGGTNDAPILDIRNVEVLAPSPEFPERDGIVEVLFDLTLRADLAEGTIILNQADLLHEGSTITLSNDPNVSGPLNAADPGERVPDPTQLSIYYPLPGDPHKTSEQSTVTIGEELIYVITVPGAPESRPLYDVEVIDALDPNLELLSAAVTGVDATGVVDASTADEVRITISEIAPGQQAVIEVRTRVRNIDTAQQGTSIDNTASYAYANTPGGPVHPALDSDAVTVVIFEPYIEEVIKTPSDTAPTAGDILRYSVTLTAAGGSSPDVFDVSLIDTLGLGLAYAGNPEVTSTPAGTVGADNTIGEPVIAGDGVDTPQTLRWAPDLGNADIDIPGGGSVTISYDVRVLDGALAGEALENSVVAEWTSLDGPSAFERDGSDGIDGLNNYITEPVSAVVTTRELDAAVAKTRIGDTFGEADPQVRIGDIVTYELRVTVPEGTLGGVELVDTLPQGLQFEGLASINGANGPVYSAVAPFIHADIDGSAVSVTGDAAAGPTTVTVTLGNLTNQPNDGESDDFVIVYRARVLNEVLAHTDSIDLENLVELGYDTATGRITQTDEETITVVQPTLTVAKSSSPPAGSVIAGGDVVTYTVEIHNAGTAPAYDVVLEDVIPDGIRSNGVTVVSASLASGTTLPTPAYSSYDPATGLVQWDLDSGVADAYTVPPGDTLVLVYSVQADEILGPGMTLTNEARVTTYYSFDNDDAPSEEGIVSEREVYGPTDSASTSLYTTAPPLKLLVSPAGAEATIGEDVVYEITVPETPVSADLSNVVISDSLDARLAYQGSTQISGPAVTDNSTGSELNFTVAGIPAGEQVVIQVTVRVLNVESAQAPETIENTVSYTFSGAAAPSTSPPAVLTLVEPELTMSKSVSNVTNPGEPAAGGDTLEYSLTVVNTGTATAYDTNVTDVLPEGVSLVDGSATASINGAEVIGFNPAPTVGAPNTLTWGMGNGDGSLDIPADGGELVLTYRVTVDAILAAEIVNNAWVDWTSLDGIHPDDRERTGEGCPVTAAPNEYCFGPATATIEVASDLAAVKTVFNVTSGQAGDQASPGDQLRYTITIENTGQVPVNNLRVVDELDALNASPMFESGSLTVVSVPNGAGDTSDPNGGAQGSGRVEVDGITIDAGQSVSIVFEATLVPVIASGTVVFNQGTLMIGEQPIGLTDDPSIAGSQDPTETLITSAPQFRVWKTSQIMEGDPAVLLAGELLRYTITVKNIGTEDAVDVVLRDYVPANTTYVPNSTTLNGAPVSDPAAGVSPLQDGILIYAPADPTPGHMPADSSDDTANVATITFDVRININVVDGTIISNQGFVLAHGEGSGEQPEVPSDDPNTPEVNDPTRNLVGNSPLVRAHKTVALDPERDFGTPGIVDPGDTLVYTIVLTNPGPIPATGVVLVDDVPGHTTYVPNSLRVNGLALPNDGGISPLIAGIPVSSSDLTPPLPGDGEGTLNPGQQAVVTFRVEVNDGTASGTVISNQGTVRSNELPDEPTDADGNPFNGHQPTQVVVGDAQYLVIDKQVSVVGGSTALAGSQLEYVVQVTNIASVPATNVVITDDLSAHGVGVLTYVDGSGRLNGGTAGVSYAAPVLTGDYAAVFGDLPPGQSATLRFRATLDESLETASTVTNTAIVQWNNPLQDAQDSASVDIGAVPGEGALSGLVWHDANFNRQPDEGEVRLAGWSVEVYRNGVLLGSTLTDANGAYSFGGLASNDYLAIEYELRFRAPGAGPNTARLGYAHSPFTDGLQVISDIAVPSGSNLQALNLPIEPNGVVYNAVSRTPVPGSTLTMVRADNASVLPTGCFDDPAQQQQVTSASGYYRFDLNFSEAGCLSGGSYLIRVTPPPTGFVGEISQIIPPQSHEESDPFSVPLCLGSAADGDAIPATTDRCEASFTPLAPPSSVAARSAGTHYYLNLTLDSSQPPGSSQIFNNHIPLDPELGEVVAISKTSGKINVARSDLVPFTITVNNTFGINLPDIRIVDTFPPGFKYVEGSSRYNGEPLEPKIVGNQLHWDNLLLESDSQHQIQLLFIVGAGVSDGEYINRAQVLNMYSLSPVSGEAMATVRVVPDPTLDCTDIVGKVFDDRNLNGVQDDGEAGIAGARIVSARGHIVTTDKHGRFHLACAVVPNDLRGSNYILKLDDRSLPTGYRVTTENPRVQRATRGKMMRFNFGATLHHVVRVDIGNGVFKPDSIEMRDHWKPRIDLLLAELKKAPSVLRISYLADVEQESLVRQRVAAMKRLLAREWEELDCCYQLSIETEVFWRRGAPPSRAGVIDR
jgi:large repetitive protein